ncbi:M1 family aminopeptidase [Pedobacter nutrimenti]|uniref:Peptidase M1 membrane alanine aminopeptidase domain-containing protein n=1 Tax=Pedobacter nutrimenti TaxID=1241337 RepID=A0A318UL53_9SPHI|nr:M1 family aminopeptidase [Pedobacter nutrimenti]PYF74745.1 hypothetical protein B0O44_103191 [Pedobacter nutrimenti]
MDFRTKFKYVFTCCMLICSTIVYGQKNLHYNLHVDADLPQKTFKVKGDLWFETTEQSRDSVEIVLSKGKGEAQLDLSGMALHIAQKLDTFRNASNDIVYRFRFPKKLDAGTRLQLKYEYDRGSVPSFQYSLDANFCMASGYGSAWYPQVNRVDQDGSKGYMRGAGQISVSTKAVLTAIMAASKLDTVSSAGMKTYRFTYDRPDIFSLYIANYQVNHHSGTIPCYTYTLKTTVCDPKLITNTSEVIAFLTEKFGALHIPNFSIIELPEYVAEQTGIGGASLLGGILIPTSELRRFNYALFGHEVSHQWWGNLIESTGTKGNAMLSEGLAQYGSLQVVDHFDQKNAILYRKTGYPGYISDQSGIGYLKNASAGIDEPLTDLKGSNEHIIADSKGFLVLELLSNTIGKEKFHAALKQITTKYTQSRLNWASFVQEIEKAHGSSLGWFFKQWCEQTGVPDWTSSWTQLPEGLQVQIAQQGPVYRLSIELQIVFMDNTVVIRKMEVNARNTTMVIPVKGKVKSVSPDPEFKIPHWAPDLAEQARALGKTATIQKLRMEQKFQEAEKLALSYIGNGIPDDRFGLEFKLLYYLGRIKANEGKTDEALAYYKRAVQMAVRTPDFLAYTYFRIAQIAAGRKDQALFHWAKENALSADALNKEADHMIPKMENLENGFTK